MTTNVQLLVGKFCLGTRPHAGRCQIEAAIDDAHFLVRFDGHNDCCEMPEHLMVVALSDIVRADGSGDDDEQPPWLIFDTAEQRDKYRVWLDALVANDDKPKLVRMPPARRDRH